MTSDKVSAAPRSTSHDEKYEDSLLDFLNKEIATAKPNRDSKVQADEMDLLVSDLLKQAIKESDQQQDVLRATPEETNAVLSSLLYGQEAVSPENKDSLANLNLEFDPPAKIADAPSDESVKLQPVVDISNEKTSISSKQPFPLPTNTDDIERSNSTLKAVGPSPMSLTLSNQAASISAASMALNGRTFLKIIAFLCLLVVVGVGFYQFRNTHNNASKKEGIQPNATAPAISASDNSAKQPSLNPTGNGIVQRRVESVSNKVDAITPFLNSGAALPAPNHSPIGTAAQESTIQVAKGVSNGKAYTTPASASGSAPYPVSAKADEPEPKDSSSAQITHSESMAKPEPVRESPIASTPASPSPQDSGAAKSPVQSVPSSDLSLESINSIPMPSVPTAPTMLDLTPAVLISKANPSYPAIALRTRSSATIVLEIDIDKQGNVVKATPASGPEVFYSEAIKAVMKWRYKPASLRGNDVASQSRVTIHFSLK